MKLSATLFVLATAAMAHPDARHPRIADEIIHRERCLSGCFQTVPACKSVRHPTCALELVPKSLECTVSFISCYLGCAVNALGGLIL